MVKLNFPRSAIAPGFANMVKYSMLQGLFYLQHLVPGLRSSATRSWINRWLLARFASEIGARSLISRGLFVFQRGPFRCSTNLRFGYSFSAWSRTPFSVRDNPLAWLGVKVICGVQ